VALVLLPILLGSCSVIYPLGVALNDERPTVLFPACTNVRVYGVGLSSSDGYTQYWTISSESGSALTEYVIGETPPGFVETRPLREPADRMEVVVWVDPEPDRGPGAETTFIWGGLEPGRIWSDGEYITGAKLRSEIQRSRLCDDGLIGLGRDTDVFVAVLLAAALAVVVVSHFTSRWFARRNAAKAGARHRAA
jgi:hypothetical protein